MEAAWTSYAVWTAVFIDKVKYECEMIGNDLSMAKPVYFSRKYS